MKKVFIIGGGGYVGSFLSDYLSNNGYECTVYDLMIYGRNVFKEKDKINVIEGDIRDIDKISYHLKDNKILVHLACISNDPSFELNPNLGKEINYNSFLPLLEACNNSNIKRFIYASSSSVYGIKNKTNVTEEDSLQPLTDYSKYKALCEEELKNFNSKNFTKTIVRPATVCGFSRRQRFDVVVNLLSNLAYNNRLIRVFGGDQLRPNIHIKDMVRAYKYIIEASNNKISDQIFNVGYENLKVHQIATKVKKVFGQDIKIEKVNTNDNRSYHINSDKIERILNFKPKFSVEDAIKELKDAFNKNIFKNSLKNEQYFNIKMMKKINLK